MGLAAVGFHNGLYVLRPLPSRLHGHSAHREAPYGYYINLTILKGPSFVRSVQILLFNFWRISTSSLNLISRGEIPAYAIVSYLCVLQVVSCVNG